MNWPEPIYFRIGRGREPDVYDTDIIFEIGKAIEHSQGDDLTIIACGMPVKSTLDAAAALRNDGFSVGVIDMATIKPLDRDAVLGAAQRSSLLMTVEEHNIIGGLGAAVAEVLADEGCGVKLVRHGLRDEYSLIGPPHHLYAHYKLDAAGIEEMALRSLKKSYR